MNATNRHVDCWVSEPCEAGDPSSCPKEPDRRKIAARDKGRPWSPLELRRDGGGNRHYLDGKPVYCGAGIELQATDRRADDYGEYSVALGRGVVVRYEASLSRDPPRATLHAGVGGHEFVASLESWMRFRWPE